MTTIFNRYVNDPSTHEVELHSRAGMPVERIGDVFDADPGEGILMQKVRFEDGYEAEAFLDELTDVPDGEHLVDVWSSYRSAVAANTAAIRAEGPRPDLEQFPANIRYVHLPTFSPLARAQQAWMDAVARYRAAHPRPGTEEVGFVAQRGSAYEAHCPVHPWFRRIAWSTPATPTSSAREHNVEHHGGAPVVVVHTPDLVPSSLLP